VENNDRSTDISRCLGGIWQLLRWGVFGGNIFKHMLKTSMSTSLDYRHRSAA
jgi:hypothetical protein